MKTKNLILTTAIILLGFLFTQCSKDDDNTGNEKGQVSVAITDAPSDDANIQGTFVTVSEIKVDGKTVDGFTKQTIEISAYHEGNAKLLFDDEVDAGTYNSVTMVLDYETDASGDSPGCFVLTKDNMKHNLAAASQTKGELTFNKTFEVLSNSQNSLVIDFDLRKSVVYDDESSNGDEYNFVTSAEMANSVRIVDENNSGEIYGSVSSMFNAEGELFVFAYKKGQYNGGTESQAQGASQVFFANAVSSAKVNADGSYTLSFLEEGNYEIHIASYEEGTGTKSTFKSMINASSTISGLLLNNVSVSAEAQVQLNISISGLS